MKRKNALETFRSDDEDDCKNKAFSTLSRARAFNLVILAVNATDFIILLRFLAKIL